VLISLNVSCAEATPRSATAEKKTALNPFAKSFSFNPMAKEFTPSGRAFGIVFS